MTMIFGDVWSGHHRRKTTTTTYDVSDRHEAARVTPWQSWCQNCLLEAEAEEEEAVEADAEPRGSRSLQTEDSCLNQDWQRYQMQSKQDQAVHGREAAVESDDQSGHDHRREAR